MRGWPSLALLAGILGAVGVAKLAAQPAPGGGPPPPEMLKACLGKALGASCLANAPQRPTLAGTCLAPPGGPLACRPLGGPGRPLPRGGPQGPAIAGTKANTSSILCGKAIDTFNSGLGLRSVARWTCSGGQRTLIANGIPDHPAGRFPNPNNPNRLAAQSISYSTTLAPVARAGPGTPLRVPGYALNGVRLDPGSGGRCTSKVSRANECTLDLGHGDWAIEALGQKLFNFGVDANNAHVQPDGAYHYHGIPQGMLSAQARAGQAMALIGWAADGFPIYARFGHSDPMGAKSSLRAMRSSYQLKSTPEPGRPATGILPLGVFTQDYRYVKGSGHLDECNGLFGVTPEFPKGVYHYYATETFPYVQRCVKGMPPRDHQELPPR